MNKLTLSFYLISGLVLTACGGKDEIATGKPAMAAPIVDVQVLKPQEIDRKIQIPGTILPSEDVIIFPEISGRVQKIAFQEGQRVSKGALLVVIDTDILKAQRKQVQVEFDLAKKDEARKKKLLLGKGISEEEYEKSASALASIQAQLDLLQVQISKGEIRAPFSGRIGLRRISEGAYITPTSQITSLVADNAVKVEFAIAERYASQVKIGQTISFQLDNGSKTYDGKVYAFESFVDKGTRMLTLRAQLNNDGKLFPGAFVSISYDLGKESGAFMVPSVSIVPVLKGQIVYAARQGKVVEVPVQLGIRTADEVQIIGELQSGDQILTSGLLAVKPGMPVKIKTK